MASSPIESHGFPVFSAPAFTADPHDSHRNSRWPTEWDSLSLPAHLTLKWRNIPEAHQQTSDSWLAQINSNVNSKMMLLVWEAPPPPHWFLNKSVGNIKTFPKLTLNNWKSPRMIWAYWTQCQCALIPALKNGDFCLQVNRMPSSG